MTAQTPSEQTIRAVMETLAATYHGRGSVELGDPFQVLVATVISQRTREEQTTAVSARVFARYPDAAALAQADEPELYGLLQGSEYREEKAPRLIALAKILVAQYGGQVPNTVEALLTLPGVGRKTANCVLIYAFNTPALCVDIHMHRITNRLGWVTTKTPDATEKALEKIMPQDLWAGSNRLFLQHGRAICCLPPPFAVAAQYKNVAHTARMPRQRSGKDMNGPDPQSLHPMVGFPQVCFISRRSTGAPRRCS